MSKKVKILCLGLFVVGLLIGPAYLTYGWYFSGEKIVDVPIKDRNSININQTVTLKPEMNPVIIRMKGSFTPSSSKNKTEGMVNRYYVKLQQGNDGMYRTIYLGWVPNNQKQTKSTGWLLGFEEVIPWASKGSSNSEWLYSRGDPIRVSESKQFELAVSKDPNRHEIRMNHLELEVIRDVVIPDPKIFTVGIGLMVLSLLISFTALETASTQDS